MKLKTLSAVLASACCISVLAAAETATGDESGKLKNVDCDMVHKVEQMPQASVEVVKALAKKAQPTDTRLHGSIMASASPRETKRESQNVATVADIAKKASAKGTMSRGSIMRTRIGTDTSGAKEGSAVETPGGFVKTKEPGF